MSEALSTARSQVSPGQTPTKRSTRICGPVSSSAPSGSRTIAAVEARHDRAPDLGPGGEVGVLERLVVAVPDQRIVPPGQAFGEAGLVGDIGQHAAQRQMRVEGLELVGGGQDVVAVGLRPLLVGREELAAGRGRGCGTGTRRRCRGGRGRGGRRRPTSGRWNPAGVSLPTQARRRENTWSGQRLSWKRSASQSAQGTRPVKVAGSRRPWAPIAGVLSGEGAAVSPTLIIQIETSSEAAVGEDGVHRVGDEEELAADRDLGADGIGALGPDRRRVVIDFEIERRIARLGRSWRGRARPPGRPRGSRPRGPPRRPRPAAGPSARGSSPSR